MAAMTCERFEEILVDFFEGDLPAESKAAANAHARECASCAAVVSDVERITRDAAALPTMQPSRDLWMEIEDRISAPVLTLAPPAHRGHRFGAGWMAAAAAALIVTTAGVTYLATSRTTARPRSQVATLPTKPVVANVNSNTPAADATPSTVASAEPATGGNADEPRAATPSSGRLASNTQSGDRTANKTPVGTLGSPQADAAYAHEIAILERMVNSANSGLDPATVAVVKTNLKVIDDAIEASKAALAKDPASPLLFNQMTRAMGRKVELLRTMASLSSST